MNVTCLEPEPFLGTVSFSVVALIACVHVYEREKLIYSNVSECFWSTQNV